jgi:hypothetical protein
MIINIGLEKVRARIEQILKDTGQGQVLIKIQDKKIVYIQTQLGEQVKDDS